jgi:anti-sigma-K factor RskA
MTCETFIDTASEYIDGTLDEAVRAEAEAHLDGCEDCRALLADLRKVQRAAGSLEPVVPPADAWARVLERLQADPAFATTSASSRRAPRSAGVGYRSMAWLAMAALLVLAVGGALVYMVRQPAPPASTSTAGTQDAGSATATVNADPNDLVQSVEIELQAAASHYEKAITSLELVANASDSPLDPDVTATLRANLQVIDAAIADSRTALRAQPDSQFAQESLFDAFRRKVSLLQDTIALMNEMRKGNPEGAARVVEGLNKS